MNPAIVCVGYFDLLPAVRTTFIGLGFYFAIISFGR